MQSHDLTGKVALVVGASRGIGEHISHALAASGAAVAVAARTETEGKLPGTIHSVAAAIRAGGGTAFPVRCDVTDEDSVNAAVDATVAELGGIDILVANAGTAFLGKTVDTPLKRWELCMKVNLTGMFLVTKAALPHIIERGSGSLIGLTTVGTYRTDLGSNAYWASKAGFERFYLGLATELREHNIAVNLLGPQKVVVTPGNSALGTGLSADQVEPPEVIAACAVALAAQDAGGITGTIKWSLDFMDELQAAR